MSPAEIIEHATKDGVLLALSRSGSMSVKGVQSAVDRWLPAIWQSKAAIVLLLRPGTDGWSAEDWQGRPQTGAETLAAVEDAQMSTFDESLDFRGFLSEPPSKMLIPPSLSALDDDEHLHSPTSPASVSGETRELRAAFGRPGGVPRAWMEGLSRFDPDWPPGDVPVERWRTSSSTSDVFSMVGGEKRPRRLAGGQLTCSAATAIGHMRGGSTKPACSGSSTATGWWRCPRTRRR